MTFPHLAHNKFLWSYEEVNRIVITVSGFCVVLIDTYEKLQYTVEDSRAWPVTQI